jgi:iron only hydrogenase large subunit-like protein
MEQGEFFHALKIRTDLCIGCTHCIQSCPTEALRVHNGKAVLAENRCVDCGECFRVCPVYAINIEQDDFDKIFQFKVRVALVPAVFIGQFPEEISTDRIYSGLMELGFTHVYEVEHGVEILLPEIEKYLLERNLSKPVMSSFCPAIVRLIQVKFPAFTDHIMQLKPPVDISAIYNRQRLIDEGNMPEDIGLFYVTPCAAKIAAVKSPVGEKFSEVNGVISMNFLYNKVLSVIKQGQKECKESIVRQSVQDTGIVWSLTRGESKNLQGRCLAIDGIHNVMEFLEKLENQDATDIDFLELRACDESCAGGVLTSGNRFLTAERLHNRAEIASRRVMKGLEKPSSISSYHQQIQDKLFVGKIKPRSMMKLDDDMATAMKKMHQVHELLLFLPQVDCGTCGSPNCAALAEDIVQGKAAISKCLFVHKLLEERGVFSPEESVKVLEEIWGKEKFNRRWLLNL